MNTKQLEQFPFFTGKMLKAFFGKKHPATTLSRWKKNLIVIEKGKYTVHQNPLVYATTLTVPSYCSFLSALSYYHLTTQIPLKVQVITNRQKKALKEITFTKSQHMFGYLRIQVNGFDVFMVEKEKLLLDCLMHSAKGVLPSELTMLLKERLDLKKIVRYLKKINDVSLIKRVGYLLELNNKHIYTEFEKTILGNRNYSLLNPKLPKTTNTNSKWRLNINEEIII